METISRIQKLLEEIKHLTILSEDIISDAENEVVTEKALEQQTILDTMAEDLREMESLLKEK